MIEPGKYNKLRIIKEVPFGVYLDGQNLGEILLPKKYVPKDSELYDQINVFLYFDSEDKLIATTQTPQAQVGECAFLRVIDVNAFGAFLHWGLDKDLLVPKAEQQRPMEKDKSYNVYLRYDNQGRIVASSKLNYYLDKLTPSYQHNEEVELLIDEPTPLGTKVIINSSHWGLVHTSDAFQRLFYGKKMKGYIKTLREDGKIDVTVRKMGQDRIADLATRILHKMNAAGGFLPIHDKSPAQDIERLFGESKKSFKNAIGSLYKQKKIIIEAEGIRLKEYPQRP